MEEILSELNSGNPVLIESSKLPDFWAHCKSDSNLYSFRYEYQDNMVKIIPTKDTILIIKRNDRENKIT